MKDILHVAVQEHICAVVDNMRSASIGGLLAGKCKRIMILCILSVIALLQGCGTKKIQLSTTIGESLPTTTETRDVLKTSWIEPSDKLYEVAGWEIVQYVSGFAKATDDEYNLYMNRTISGNNTFYSMLFLEELEGGNQYARYEFKRADLSTLTICSLFQTFSELNFGSILDINTVVSIDEKLLTGQAMIISMDCTGNILSIFILVNDLDGNPEHFYKVDVNADKVVIAVTDYINFLSQKLDNVIIPEMICDQKGYVYCLDYANKTIGLIDDKGKEICTVEARDFINSIKCIGKNPEGIPIFSNIISQEEAEFFYIDGAGKQTLYAGKIYSGSYSIDQYGNFLILNGSRLFYWDISMGDLYLLYDFDNLGNYVCMGLAGNDRGEIIVCFEDGEDAFLYRLNKSDKTTTRELVLLQYSSDPYIEECASEYSRTHPGVIVRVETMDISDQFSWNKFTSMLTDDKGPDLIVANIKQLKSLKTIGAICPMEGILPDEIQNSIFEGALKTCTFDDVLYAVPFEVFLDVWLISNDKYAGNYWTLEEAMKRFSEWKETTDGDRFLGINYGIDPLKLFLYLCVKNIDSSEFLNIDAGECCFETDSFYNLLDFCRRNGDTPRYFNRVLSDEDCINELICGDAFLTCFEGGLKAYSYYRKKLGDKFHVVGTPSENQIRSVVSCYKAVSVNSLSSNKDIAADFISSLVSDEYQSKYTTYWVRRDTLTNHIRNAWELHKHTENGEEPEDNPAFEINKRLHVPLEGKDDGTSYADEYIALMDAGSPNSTEYEIQDIVMEEASAFFLGEKTEQEVAKIIQHRVQLYLDEISASSLHHGAP